MSKQLLDVTESKVKTTSSHTTGIMGLRVSVGMYQRTEDRKLGMCLQARAHVLLKAKEAEIKTARAAGAASDAHLAELQEARAARADAEAACEAVRALTAFLQNEGLWVGFRSL